MARSDIRFLLGFEPKNLAGLDPTCTVLDWLRDEVGLTGTKEGCAEGDCGACTVVLAEIEGETLSYRAVNACILFLPQLDGRQLITVEHLKDESGRLHPIQQAMIDHHASQCGFCTPGFVLSLFALAKDLRADAGSKLRRETVSDALQGNLCRCTGYRPIIDSALNALVQEGDDQFDRKEGQTIDALKALDRSEPLSVACNGRTYLAPTSLDDLAIACAENQAQLLAGATDVGLWVTKQHRDLDAIIDVTRVPELRRIEESEGFLKVGAACTYRQIHAAVGDRWPDFGELIRRIGGAQVRAAGTIGGNIANGSPIGDTMPALIALGARLVLRQGKARRAIQLEDFYLGYRETACQPGEFVAEIHIPIQEVVFRCYKISKRADQDISAVLAAFALNLSPDQTVSKIRVAFGGMAAVPKRAVEVEKSLLGKPWTEETIIDGQAALGQSLQPISDMRASAEYRLTAAQNLLRKFFIETTAPCTATRIHDRSAS